MSTTIDAVLATARTQLGGYYPGVSPYGQWYGTKVGAYSTYADAQFCGMFVSWVAGQVGALDIIPLHAYTPSGAAWFQAKGQWHNGKTGARAGDIVYFDFPGAPDRISHVGIVESVNSDGSLNTIEGNTSSVIGGDQRNGRTVARKRRASSIVGYGRPAYATPTTPIPTPPHAAASISGGSMFIVLCDVEGDKQRGTGWIVTPQGNGKPRATVLGGQDTFPNVPVVTFRWPTSWVAFKGSVQWA